VKQTLIESHLNDPTLKSMHATKETWDPLPLSKAYNPYYEHSGARQHKQQQNPLDIGTFLPKPI
jgi:hypothetical protein